MVEKQLWKQQIHFELNRFILWKPPTQLNWNNCLSCTFGALTEFLERLFNRAEINRFFLHKTDLFLYCLKTFKSTFKSFSEQTAIVDGNAPHDRRSVVSIATWKRSAWSPVGGQHSYLKSSAWSPVGGQHSYLKSSAWSPVGGQHSYLRSSTWSPVGGQHSYLKSSAWSSVGGQHSYLKK